MIAVAGARWRRRWRRSAAAASRVKPEFQTSDRCLACHNGLLTPSGEDVSIGFDWRASMMANSSRDPYWQASVRRETIDHPRGDARRSRTSARSATCRSRATRRSCAGRKGEVFAHLPFDRRREGRAARRQDGVSCSVCHQIGKAKLGTRESFNGGFVLDPPDAKDNRPEYGPFDDRQGPQRGSCDVVEGFRPTKADHIRSRSCARRATRSITKALGPGGKVDRRVARADAVPGVAAQRLQGHARAASRATCRRSRSGPDHARVRRRRARACARHVFVGGELLHAADAEPLSRRARRRRRCREELTRGADRDDRVSAVGGGAAVDRERRGVAGGRLETPMSRSRTSAATSCRPPIRRAARGCTSIVRDAQRPRRSSNRARSIRTARSGATTTTPTRRSSSRTTTRSASADQVQIYEVDHGRPGRRGHDRPAHRASRYIKDNRLLPHGFDKADCAKDIAVVGEAASDANFTGAGDRVRYSIAGVAGEGSVHRGGRTAVPADRLPVGEQPEEVRRGRAAPLQRLLRRDGRRRPRPCSAAVRRSQQ